MQNQILLYFLHNFVDSVLFVNHVVEKKNSGPSSCFEVEKYCLLIMLLL